MMYSYEELFGRKIEPRIGHHSYLIFKEAFYKVDGAMQVPSDNKRVLKYKILSSLENLDIYQTVDEGIDKRIRNKILACNSLEEFIFSIKTKRYTYNKINRMCSHILLNFTKKEANNFKNIEYIRVLGFNQKGRTYLNKIKKDIEFPIFTKFIKNDMLNLELRATYIYALITNDNKIISKEYKNKIIIK